MTRTARVGALGYCLVLAGTGCGLDDDSGDHDQQPYGSQATIATSPMLGPAAIGHPSRATWDNPCDERSTSDERSTGVFVLVEAREPRMCALPNCSNYRLRVLNLDVIERVFDIDVSQLDPVTLSRAADADDGELVMFGELVLVEGDTKRRRLVASRAYRGMPGAVPALGEGFFTAEQRPPFYPCESPPCPEVLATLVNTSQTTLFDGGMFDRIAVPLLQGSWLFNCLYRHEAVTAAKIVSIPGSGIILDASQVFVRLPYPDRSCPDLVPPDGRCEPGFVPVTKRTRDRCLLPDGCVPQQACPEVNPECNEGYSLMSWSARPDGCATYACDPTFASK